jgi:beta-mannosidase
MLDEFYDLSYAYRFGPPHADLVHAALLDAEGALLAEAVHLPLGLPALGMHDLGLQAVAAPLPGGALELTVSARRYAHAVSVEATGYRADDQYFNVLPGHARKLRLHPIGGNAPEGIYGQVQAINSLSPASIQRAQ